MNSNPIQSSFEDLYLKTREKEGRLYPDEIVSFLPEVPKTHPLFREWLIRKLSFEKFRDYLVQKNKPLNILDLGCGNGWMSNKLCEINGSVVTGFDKNSFEINQAKRVFQNNTRLNFYSDEDFSETNVVNDTFDVVVMAASIQYFPDLKQLMNQLFPLLNPEGEIHILDSPFYSQQDVARAKESSKEHYTKLECIEMAGYYHHHAWEELSGIHHKIINRSLIDKFLLKTFKTKKNYFPWVIIYKS